MVACRRVGGAPTSRANLAFIYYYTKIHGVPPAEAEMQQYFGVTSPTVHQMGWNNVA